MWRASFESPIRGLRLGLVLAHKLRRLGPTLQPAFLEDRRDLGVGDEALPAPLIPVEDHPDTALLIGIAKDGRTFGPVLLSLLSAFGREGILEAVEILSLRRCQDQLSPPLLEVSRSCEIACEVSHSPRGSSSSPTLSDACSLSEGAPFGSVRIAVGTSGFAAGVQADPMLHVSWWVLAGVIWVVRLLRR